MTQFKADASPVLPGNETMNFNYKVYVKLSEEGRRIYRDTYLKLGIKEHQIGNLEVDEYGFTEFQLHELMSIFGKHMYNGNPNLPFQTMDFRISTKSSF